MPSGIRVRPEVVFAVNWPTDFIEVERAGGDLATEQRVFGADHTLVGAYLLALGGLPDDIVEAVAQRFAPSHVELRERGDGFPSL